MTPMPWNSTVYPLMNIEKDKWGDSVLNVEKRDLPAIALNTTKAIAPTIIDYNNKANTSNEGRVTY